MGNNGTDVRKLDQLGRIVLPKTVRDALNVGEGDALSVRLDGEKIVLEVYEKGCIFCGSTEGLTEHKGKVVCEKCRKALAK